MTPILHTHIVATTAESLGGGQYRTLCNRIVDHADIRNNSATCPECIKADAEDYAALEALKASEPYGDCYCRTHEYAYNSYSEEGKPQFCPRCKEEEDKSEASDAPERPVTPLTGLVDAMDLGFELGRGNPAGVTDVLARITRQRGGR